MSDAIEKAALRLREAGETHQPCAPVRDLIAPTDVASAYAVQEINTKYWLGRGPRLVGRKIGLNAVAVQKQLGGHQTLWRRTVQLTERWLVCEGTAGVVEVDARNC